MRLVFQLPASITSVVDAPRLVSSDASPIRPECAVTRLSTPAACAAAVNRNPIICADNGTTRSPGSGLVADRNVRMARDPVLHEPHVVRRIPAMKSNPAITASTRPRSSATTSDSTPRPRRRGRWQVATTAARSETPNGRA